MAAIADAAWVAPPGSPGRSAAQPRFGHPRAVILLFVSVPTPRPSRPSRSARRTRCGLCTSSPQLVSSSYSQMRPVLGRTCSRLNPSTSTGLFSTACASLARSSTMPTRPVRRSSAPGRVLAACTICRRSLRFEGWRSIAPVAPRVDDCSFPSLRGLASDRSRRLPAASLAQVHRQWHWCTRGSDSAPCASSTGTATRTISPRTLRTCKRTSRSNLRKRCVVGVHLEPRGLWSTQTLADDANVPSRAGSSLAPRLEPRFCSSGARRTSARWRKRRRYSHGHFECHAQQRHPRRTPSGASCGSTSFRWRRPQPTIALNQASASLWYILGTSGELETVSGDSGMAWFSFALAPFASCSRHLTRVLSPLSPHCFACAFVFLFCTQSSSFLVLISSCPRPFATQGIEDHFLEQWHQKLHTKCARMMPGENGPRGWIHDNPLERRLMPFAARRRHRAVESASPRRRRTK